MLFFIYYFSINHVILVVMTTYIVGMSNYMHLNGYRSI